MTDNNATSNNKSELSFYGRLFATNEMARSLLLGLAWLLLWRASVLMEFAPHASIWFPPAGLTFAAFLIMGIRAMPILMLCSIIVTFWVDNLYAGDQSLLELAWTGLLFGAAHCISHYSGATVLRSLMRRAITQVLPQLIIGFLVLCTLSALAAALFGSQALALTGMISQAEIGSIWLPWWIGDMAGAMVLAPLFIGVLSWRYPQIEAWLGGLNFDPIGSKRLNFCIKIGLLVFLASLVMLLAAHFRYQEVAFAMFFLLIPQMWIAYSETPFRLALSLAVFSLVIAIGVATLGLLDQALVYQFAISLIAASAYFGLAVPVLIEQNRQLRNMAQRDGLTQVASREHFFDMANEELQRAIGYRHALSLILFDLDHFKQINDQYGHTVGDQALRLMAEAVSAEKRQADVLGRFGGDEFMLLLPGNGLQRASETAERIRQLLESIHIQGTANNLSASFGVVELQSGESVMGAFERADVQLLEAKRSGRNRVQAG
ncbi:diguanylate cyclase [Aliiglaciecola sp. CAU 1673]|uniref:sensor domain-containing diguanylate cyclase n=1 Tax=Aliiglaciecola sp. CAU 1673 TaxID=3032595 RepID=UPI0023DA4861|nr:diguanylate cyclase [Aliiglaciecola sp. CAU 1673]MDF2178630.1 diguanylate cyclase [Aliiglaciecola sp. CAU 1673]